MIQTSKYTYEFMVHATIRTIPTSESGMEALELDMPSETVSIPESLPPLEGMSINFAKLAIMWINLYCSKKKKEEAVLQLS